MAIRKKSKKTAEQKTKDLAFSKLANDIWPMERDIFFRPARLKYVRKLIQPKGCVFCTSAEKDLSVKTLCVYKSLYSQIVVNKFPYNSGHLLVLPLRHTGDLLTLSDEEYVDIQMTVRLAMQALNAIYQPQGFNIGLNHGATAGAGIPGHIHYHIVPRWHGDLNFFPLIAETKLVIEEAEVTYKKIRSYFSTAAAKGIAKTAGRTAAKTSLTTEFQKARSTK